MELDFNIYLHVLMDEWRYAYPLVSVYASAQCIAKCFIYCLRSRR